MHYENQIDNDYPSRPLLPTDEETLTSKILKSKVKEHNNSTEQTRFDLSNLTLNEKNEGNNLDKANLDLLINKRSVSNRNMNSLLESSCRKYDIQKALTDTDNFIEIFNRDNKVSLEEQKMEKYEQYISQIDAHKTVPTQLSDTITEIPNNNQPEIDEYNSSQDTTEDGMTIDPDLKKRRDKWADRGAAKIIKDIINPKTGEKSKKIIKKGIKDFKFGDIIGDGAYSVVKLATAIDSGKKYAVKVLDKAYLIKQKKVKYVNIEKNALQRVNNSYAVIKLYFTFQDESSLYFLLEYAPNGDLLSLLKKYGSLNENAVRYYSAQIIDAINFLHLKGIIHRDIKPENILLDSEWKIKLTDFGTAKLLERIGSSKKYDLLTRSKSFVGTAEYVSPELLNDSYVDYRCDIWAFGCILFQMIAGKPPFKATNEYLTFQKVMKVQYAFTAGFPTVIRDLVKRILIKHIDQRLTIPQIEKHHFYKSVNFKDGSVWSNPVPELSAYKVTAKSMQRIPELKGPIIYKRPQGSTAVRKSTSALTSTYSSQENSKHKFASASNIHLTSTAGCYVANPQDTNTLPSMGNTIPSSSNRNSNEFIRKKSYEKSPAISKNGMRNAGGKPVHSSKRNISSSSYRSVVSSSSKNLNDDNLFFQEESSSTTIPVPTTKKQSVNNPVLVSPSPLLKVEDTMKKSELTKNSKPGSVKQVSCKKHTNTINSISQHQKKTKDNLSIISLPNHNNDSKSHAIKEVNVTEKITSVKVSAKVSPRASPKVFSHYSMNKHDIQWSIFLRSIEEHILQVQEVYLNIVDTTTLDRKLSKYNRKLSEPSEVNHGRSTLLSQVVRNGGNITGFRHADSLLSESQYYSINNIDVSTLIDDYRQPFEFLALVMSDENTDNIHLENPLTPTNLSNLTSSEESHSSAFSGKFKKFFQQAKNATLLEANSFHERFHKRTVIVTSFGRLLICVKNQQQLKNASNNFELVYDIDLCQIGVEFKDIIMKNHQNNMFVIQTPYKSFILCNLNNTLESKNTVASLQVDNWFKMIKKSITLANEKRIRTHSKHSPQHSINDESNGKIKHIVKSPNSVHKSKTPKITSPKIVTHEKKAFSGQSSENKHSFSSSLKAANTDKGTRMFESFVNSREKQHRKHIISPIPTSSKLVSGLPSTSASALLGLGLGLSSNGHQERQSTHSNTTSVSTANSNLNQNNRPDTRH